MAKLFVDESEAFNRAMQLRAFQRSYSGDEALASRVVSNQRAWPQLAPGANLALAHGGVDPSSPTAQEAARLAQKAKAKRGFFDQGLGKLVKTGVRWGLTALSFGPEEATGLLRTGAVRGGPGSATPGFGGLGIGGPIAQHFLGDKVEGEGGFRPQSVLAQAVQGKDLGEGFFPAGEAREVAVRAQQRTATVGGHALTPGRLVAANVVEPGTAPYNTLSGLIDFGFAMKADPTALAGAKLAKVNAARKTILPEKAKAFIDSEPGAAIRGALRDESSPYRIWQMSRAKIGAGQLGAPQLPVDVAVRLANTSDDADIYKILETELGTSVRTKFDTKVRRINRQRLGVDMPRGELDWDDPASFVTKVDEFQRLAKVPTETRLTNNDNIMRALAGPRTGRLDPVRALSSTMADALVAQGMDANLARKSTRLLGDSIDDARLYTAAEIGTNTRVPGLVINGEGVPVVGPSLLSEFLDAPLHLPGPRDLRGIRQEVNGFLGPIVRTPYLGDAFRNSDILFTDLVNRIWKAGVLLRPAIILRVGGEEQIRMATAGYDSVFAHPLSYIVRATGKRGAVSATGDRLADSIEAQRAMSQGAARLGMLGEKKLGESLLHTKHRARYSPGEDDYLRAWRDHELGHLRSDPIAQHVAKHGADATKDWLWNGAGRKFLNDLRLNRPNDPVFMSTELDVTRYVDDVVGKRLSDFTRGDQRVLDYVIAGRKEGAAEIAARTKISEVLDELTTAGNRPAHAVGDIAIAAQKGSAQIIDRAVTGAFSWLMQKPTNKFQRSPVFAEAYWNRAEELANTLRRVDQEALLTNARKANLSPAQLQRIEGRIASGAGDLKLDHVDHLAKGHALEEVQTLLYDLSKRGMTSDALRLIMPFAEPWKEMMTTWSRLLVQKPQAVRRFQQVVEGARGPGWFQKDEQTGEEVFVYPGSEFVSKLVTGVPIPFKGHVSGLNLFAQNPLYPGFGPLVQIAAGALLPNKPEFDWIQDAVNPFGRPEGSIFEQFLAPAAWMDKLRKAAASPESDRLFANTTFDASRYLHSKGGYDLASVEDQERLSRDSISVAKKLYLLRTLGSATLPAAPSPEWKSALKDSSGRLITQWALSDEFHKLQDEDYDTAVEKFLDTYGEEALLYMQPKSKGGGPSTDEAMDFVRSNPEIASRYPEVYHYFGPQGGEFSITAYERLLASGKKEAIGPDEAIKLANHRVAAMRWSQAKDKVGTRANSLQKQWLDTVRQGLLDEYPGWEPEPRDPHRITRHVRQLEEALGDKKLASTEVGRALGLYFLARTKAMGAAEAAGLQRGSFAKAKRMQGAREWLRAVADRLIDDHPEFAAVWDRVLNNELADDEPSVLDAELPTEEAFQ